MLCSVNSFGAERLWEPWPGNAKRTGNPIRREIFGTRALGRGDSSSRDLAGVGVHLRKVH